MEVKNLEDLIHVVDGEKYSCHATSVLDLNDVTDQMGAMTVNPKTVSLKLDNLVYCKMLTVTWLTLHY